MDNLLRQHAEEILKKNPSFTNNDWLELSEIIHELNVHQIELELQNEQLRSLLTNLEQAKQLAEKSKTSFSQLYDSTPIGFLVINTQGLICHANQAALHFLRLAPENLYEKPFVNFIAQEDRPLWLGRFKSLLKQPENKKLELRLTSEKVSPFYVEITLTKLDGWFATHFLQRGDDFSSFFLLSVIHIDERKQAEQQLLLSYSVFANTCEAIVICNAQQKIISVNPAFSKITHFNFTDVYGEKLIILNPEKNTQDFQKIVWQSVADSGHWQGEVLSQRKDGDFYDQWLSISTVENEKKQITHYVGIFRDISEEKKISLYWVIKLHTTI